MIRKGTCLSSGPGGPGGRFDWPRAPIGSMKPSSAVAARPAPEEVPGMAHYRSVSIALRRLQVMVLVGSWMVTAALGAHVVVWSLTSFTELRYAEAEGPHEKGKMVISVNPERDRLMNFIGPGRGTKEEPEPIPTSAMDKVFATTVGWSRGVGLIAAVCLCPLISLGLLLAIEVGAPRVERAVTALTLAMILSALALPLGGWFGMAWNQGTLADYQYLTREVEAARAQEGFEFGYFLRYLILPAVCAAGFTLAGLRFSRALEGVLLAMDDVDPQIEKEASNVEPSSLHGTGRTAGALTKLLDEGKAARAGKKPAAAMMPIAPAGAMGAGEAPKRLI